MSWLATTIVITGLIAGALLVSALAFSIARPDRGFWPTSPTRPLASAAFWLLFRVLNVATLGFAAYRIWFAPPTEPWQFAALIASAIFGLLYARTLWELGRDATYCQASGLNQSGVYRWTRNPQYAAAIAAFATLAVGVADAATALLAAALIAVYMLMARAEEPWLLRKYGPAYASYRRSTPRLFNPIWFVGALAGEIIAGKREPSKAGR